MKKNLNRWEIRGKDLELGNEIRLNLSTTDVKGLMEYLDNKQISTITNIDIKENTNQIFSLKAGLFYSQTGYSEVQLLINRTILTWVQWSQPMEKSSNP